MTIISPYGIGASQMVSGTSDDEDARSRRRRLAASQSAEQTRKSAAMRQQLAQAERAAVLAEARQRHQQERAGAMRRELQAGASAKTVDGRSTAASGTDTIQPVSLSAPADGNIPESIEEMPSHPDRHLLSLPLNEMALLSEAPDVLIARLIDDLPDWRAQRFPHDAEKLLEALGQAVAQARHAPTPDSREALEALGGSLEFVQGYLEASGMADDSRQRLVMIIDGIRQEVTVMMSAVTSPLASTSVAASAVAKAGREALRLNGSASRHRPGRVEDVDSRMASGKKTDGEDAAQLAAGGVPLVVPQIPSELAKPAAPSLSRDVDKRRNETPVSVAVRSL